jgi:hypothetical protein
MYEEIPVPTDESHASMAAVGVENRSYRENSPQFHNSPDGDRLRAHGFSATLP